MFRGNCRNAKWQQAEHGPCSNVQLQHPKTATTSSTSQPHHIPHGELQIGTKNLSLNQKGFHEENNKHQQKEGRNLDENARWSQKHSRSHAEKENRKKP